jgi:hypothetical protein
LPKPVIIKEHRYGWGYAMSGLKPFHHSDGVLVDDFIENSFSWNYHAKRRGREVPHRRPWVGFIHNPPNMPHWFGDGKSSNQHIFKMKHWKQSVSQCQVLFALSNYHRDWLRKQLPCPIETLRHPTETPDAKFTWKSFQANNQPKIVQIGWWLRRAESIHHLDTKLDRAVLQLSTPWFSAMRISPNRFARDPRVKVISYLPDGEYDQLLSQNVVFLDLYDTSANNAVIECIVRNTPVLVTDHPATREYLGQSYPLFFDSLEQAGDKSNDLGAIRAAHDYLREDPEGIKHKLQLDQFVADFVAHLKEVGIE